MCNMGKEMYEELVKADKVIGVLYAHLDYLNPRDFKRLEEDLKNRGLADHVNTRHTVLTKERVRIPRLCNKCGKRLYHEDVPHGLCFDCWWAEQEG